MREKHGITDEIDETPNETPTDDAETESASESASETDEQPAPVVEKNLKKRKKN